jgi:hypothetical protein
VKQAVRALLAVLVIGAAAACDGTSGEGTRTSRSQSSSTPAFGHVSFHYIPGVGRAEVRRVPELGLVIVDRKTDGDRFFLDSPEAETCLDALADRPRVREIIEAVCVGPGRVRATG